MSSATRAFDLEDDVEGTDGQGGDLEAAIAASRQRAQAKSLQVYYSIIVVVVQPE